MWPALAPKAVDVVGDEAVAAEVVEAVPGRQNSNITEL